MDYLDTLSRFAAELDYAGLPPAVAAHLQAVAWETAQAFHAKEGRGSL